MRAFQSTSGNILVIVLAGMAILGSVIYYSTQRTDSLFKTYARSYERANIMAIMGDFAQMTRAAYDQGALLGPLGMCPSTIVSLNGKNFCFPTSPCITSGAKGSIHCMKTDIGSLTVAKRSSQGSTVVARLEEGFFGRFRSLWDPQIPAAQAASGSLPDEPTMSNNTIQTSTCPAPPCESCGASDPGICLRILVCPFGKTCSRVSDHYSQTIRLDP